MISLCSCSYFIFVTKIIGSIIFFLTTFTNRTVTITFRFIFVKFFYRFFNTTLCTFLFIVCNLLCVSLTYTNYIGRGGRSQTHPAGFKGHTVLETVHAIVHHAPKVRGYLFTLRPRCGAGAYKSPCTPDKVLK